MIYIGNLCNLFMALLSHIYPNNFPSSTINSYQPAIQSYTFATDCVIFKYVLQRTTSFEKCTLYKLSGDVTATMNRIRSVIFFRPENLLRSLTMGQLSMLRAIPTQPLCLVIEHVKF